MTKDRIKEIYGQADGDIGNMAIGQSREFRGVRAERTDDSDEPCYLVNGYYMTKVPEIVAMVVRRIAASSNP